VCGAGHDVPARLLAASREGFENSFVSTRQVSVTLPERRYDLAGQLMARAIDDSVHDGIAVVDALHADLQDEDVVLLDPLVVAGIGEHGRGHRQSARRRGNWRRPLEVVAEYQPAAGHIGCSHTRTLARPFPQQLLTG